MLIPLNTCSWTACQFVQSLFDPAAAIFVHEESCSNFLPGDSRRGFFLCYIHLLHAQVLVLLNCSTSKFTLPTVSMTSRSHLMPVVILVALFCFSSTSTILYLAWGNETCT